MENNILEDKKLLDIIKTQDFLLKTTQENKEFSKLKMLSVEEKLILLLNENKNHSQIFSIQGSNKIENESIGQCEQLIKKIDFSILKKVFIDVESDDFETKQRALKAIALLGTPEEKQKIDYYITDEEQDISLRRDLIKNTDWSHDARRLVNIFNESNDSLIRADIIAAAESNNLQPEERASFEAALFDNFYKENNDYVKIETLDYLYNTNRDQYKFFMNSINTDELSQEIQQHSQTLE